MMEQYVGQLKSSWYTRKQANWYRGNKKRKLDNKSSKYQYNPPSKKRKQGSQEKRTRTYEKGQGRKVKAVMFVPHTAHSATRMRSNEEKMETMTWYIPKIVEKGGTKLIDILHNAYPWAGLQFGRKNCLLCETKMKEVKTNSQDCMKRNCVYETYYRTCQQRQEREIEEKMIGESKKKVDEENRRARRFIYIGETNRSACERGVEHQNDIQSCKTSSHMLCHLIAVHEEEETGLGENRV